MRYILPAPKYTTVGNKKTPSEWLKKHFEGVFGLCISKLFRNAERE